jgi:DNA-binding transcriptional ArsR family regulator
MPTNFTHETDALSATFAALSDPTRRAMLARLSLGEATVNELAAPFNMSLPAISKHIKVLEKAGLLTKTISAQQRPCKIDDVQLKQAVDWIAQYSNTTNVINATNKVAKKAINTSATAKNNSKKPVKSENPAETLAVNVPETVPKKPKFKLKIAKTTLQSKEKTNDNIDPASDLQQQIGFDF